MLRRPILPLEASMGEIAMSTIQDVQMQLTCLWCGAVSPIGVTCESCGSPMEALARCRYCQNLDLEPVCGCCRDVLVRLWRIAQESPDSRFLFADVL
jgi:hypothetical protein